MGPRAWACWGGFGSLPPSPSLLGVQRPGLLPLVTPQVLSCPPQKKCLREGWGFCSTPLCPGGPMGPQ